MNARVKKRLADKIDNEGFDYAFTYYSDFDEIKDKRFHELKEQYLAARKALQQYIGVDEC